ncbi:MAG: hypothetical protein EHM59_14215 [Betaproteobacteria bacterium]|nr:MAG: hypothetical protein EHM59_14215 [Betaproteobacteria bacterium]
MRLGRQIGATLKRVFPSVSPEAVGMSRGIVISAGYAASAFPTHPIRLIAPLAPGGSTDVLARSVTGPLGERLGQQVVVDNRPAAGGNVGAELTARAPAD